MRVFFDLEFTGLVQDTTPISIGLVSEAGDGLYAIFTDYNVALAGKWVHENVLVPESLFWTGGLEYCLHGTREDVAKWLRNWFKQFDGPVEMWGDVLAYDWVLFRQLFLPLDLPSNIGYIPFDLATFLHARGCDPDINREEFAGMPKAYKHNAFHDALIIKACWEKLNGMAEAPP